MKRGRKPLGEQLVDRLDLSEQAKDRLRVVLETLAGKRSIAEACEDLGISESQFHAIRNRAITAAGAAIEPKPAGRPPKEAPTPEQARIAALERELAETRFELEASRLREEIAVVMPHLLVREGAEKKRKP